MTKTNFHTHTMYDDGKGTINEIVEAAIEKGFSEIGFSGHSYMSFDAEFSMDEKREAAYIKDVLEAKEKYADKIKIYLGIELDYNSDMPTYNYEYVLGSVHSIKKGSEYAYIDYSLERFKEAVDKFYGGDVYAFCEDYFETVSDVYNKTNCKIIGHFDLITKFIEKEKLFDEQNPRYIKAWQKAADNLVKSGAVFEINTGAISRGYRTAPYPADNIVKYLKDKGAKFILTSDCHNKDFLDCHFDEVKAKYGDMLIESIF